MEGEWFGLTCGEVGTRLLSAKTLTSWGSPQRILGSALFDRLRFSDGWKVSHLSRVHQMSERRRRKKNPSHLLFPLRSPLPPTPSLEAMPQIASAWAFITQLTLSYCSWHSEPAQTIHLSLFILNNLWKSGQSRYKTAQRGRVLFSADDRLCIAGVDSCYFKL